jgi:hypothetical protein
VTGLPGPRRVAGRGRQLAWRVAAGTGLDEVIHLGRRVDVVAEAVAENAALEIPLAACVSELERRLVAPLEARQRLLEDL